MFASASGELNTRALPNARFRQLPGGPGFIAEHSDRFNEALLDFLRDAPRPSTVLFSIPVRSERVFGAWIHPRFGTDIYRGKRSRREMDQAPGFRPGRLPPEVELTRSFASLRVDRVIVHRADDARRVAHVYRIDQGVALEAGDVGDGVAATARNWCDACCPHWPCFLVPSAAGP